MTQVQGVLLDLDGTLYQGDRVIPGAGEAIARLRRAEIPFRFVTNTTRKPRSALAQKLRALGIEASEEEVLSAPRAAAAWLRRQEKRKVSLLLAEETHVEFDGLEVDDDEPDVVVVGDLGEGWTYDVLDRAFRALMAGGELLAIQRNRYWDTGDGLHIDAGPFVAALEYASDKEAKLIGKPASRFFETAASELALPIERIAMVGDSVQVDVAGAQGAGCVGVLVKTGAYREAIVAASRITPDAVLESIAELPRWMGL